jgi:transcriptional regulator with XRE-family HTH domain
MTLGEFIIQYREQHNMSGRSFAAMVGISPQQISNIEKGIGNDGKPMTSTMKTYKKIAEAVGMTEKDFLNMLSDNVTVNPEDDPVPQDVVDLAQLFRDRPDLRALMDVGRQNTPDHVYKLIEKFETMEEGG